MAETTPTIKPDTWDLNILRTRFERRTFVISIDQMILKKCLFDESEVHLGDKDANSLPDLNQSPV